MGPVTAQSLVASSLVLGRRSLDVGLLEIVQYHTGPSLGKGFTHAHFLGSGSRCRTSQALTLPGVICPVTLPRCLEVHWQEGQAKPNPRGEIPRPGLGGECHPFP